MILLIVDHHEASVAATGQLGSTCTTNAAGVEHAICDSIKIYAPSTCPHESKGIYRTPRRYNGNSRSATNGGVQQMRLGIGQIPRPPPVS